MGITYVLPTELAKPPSQNRDMHDNFVCFFYSSPHPEVPEGDQVGPSCRERGSERSRCGLGWKGKGNRGGFMYDRRGKEGARSPKMSNMLSTSLHMCIYKLRVYGLHLYKRWESQHEKKRGGGE